ncbi:sulfite exporter TauE/SafE family protein [Alkalinema sp. FACHB-956]|uniref:urease accessory protein UreH domain-containing protein n=1 Tax=Alkalinema sp. FACHB-956 TaxID=2692768 RepID=UPI00168733DE|nr:sulfite exporter TauE/SafE family protein [Alkalinema sp. FACHB-956]MBD2326037.1 sulfite exporter TauE/SafE family protein [Alkalinema sp. FACHB-956]
MLDFVLMTTLGFLGSFGHCLGMCGPLTAAFSLTDRTPDARSRLLFNLWLNSGRILSYGLVGAAIGGVSSIVVAGGQLAGIGSDVRRAMAIFTGLLLIWFGLVQIQPRWLPQMPLLHPLAQGRLHNWVNHWMQKLTLAPPIGLGLLWGLMPCGFLYAAQIKAAETANPWLGAATMIAFGLGTLPMMLGVSLSAAFFSRDRRSQLFQLGGWVTLAIGLLTVLRSSEMVDYTGHIALGLLMLTLIARPIAKLWSGPLQYRRTLGVGAFIFSVFHSAHTVSHTFNWNLQGIRFLPFSQQLGMVLGMLALLAMVPLALTSSDRWVQRLGQRWRQLHLLAIPAWILIVIHAILVGSSYLGVVAPTAVHHSRTIGLIAITILILAVRSHTVWSWFGWGKGHVKSK